MKTTVAVGVASLVGAVSAQDFRIYAQTYLGTPGEFWGPYETYYGDGHMYVGPGAVPASLSNVLDYYSKAFPRRPVPPTDRYSPRLASHQPGHPRGPPPPGHGGRPAPGHLHRPQQRNRRPRAPRLQQRRGRAGRGPRQQVAALGHLCGAPGAGLGRHEHHDALLPGADRGGADVPRYVEDARDA